nr:hypothetical protein CCACVL1_16155 [Ipomoea batatas]
MEKKRKKINYHNSIGQELNTIIPKGSSGKLEISKMAAEDLRGHGGNIVEQVNDDGRRRQAEQIPQLNGGRLLQPSQNSSVMELAILVRCSLSMRDVRIDTEQENNKVAVINNATFDDENNEVNMGNDIYSHGVKFYQVL